MSHERKAVDAFVELGEQEMDIADHRIIRVIGMMRAIPVIT